jgi:hypothetical protein
MHHEAAWLSYLKMVRIGTGAFAEIDFGINRWLNVTRMRDNLTP